MDPVWEAKQARVQRPRRHCWQCRMEAASQRASAQSLRGTPRARSSQTVADAPDPARVWHRCRREPASRGCRADRADHRVAQCPDRLDKDKNAQVSGRPAGPRKWHSHPRTLATVLTVVTLIAHTIASTATSITAHMRLRHTQGVVQPQTALSALAFFAHARFLIPFSYFLLFCYWRLRPSGYCLFLCINTTAHRYPASSTPYHGVYIHTSSTFFIKPWPHTLYDFFLHYSTIMTWLYSFSVLVCLFLVSSFSMAIIGVLLKYPFNFAFPRRAKQGRSNGLLPLTFILIPFRSTAPIVIISERFSNFRFLLSFVCLCRCIFLLFISPSIPFQVVYLLFLYIISVLTDTAHEQATINRTSIRHQAGAFSRCCCKVDIVFI